MPKPTQISKPILISEPDFDSGTDSETDSSTNSRTHPGADLDSGIVSRKLRSWPESILAKTSFFSSLVYRPLFRRLAPTLTGRLRTTPDNTGRIYVPELVPKLSESGRSRTPDFCQLCSSSTVWESKIQRKKKIYSLTPKRSTPYILALKYRRRVAKKWLCCGNYTITIVYSPVLLVRNSIKIPTRTPRLYELLRRQQYSSNIVTHGSKFQSVLCVDMYTGVLGKRTVASEPSMSLHAGAS